MLLDSVVEIASIGATGKDKVVAQREHSLLECVWNHDLCSWISRSDKEYVFVSAERRTLPRKYLFGSPNRKDSGVEQRLVPRGAFVFYEVFFQL